MKTICITGGHLSPAYSLASFIKKTNPEVSVLFIGREKTFTSSEFAANAIEKDVMQAVSTWQYSLAISRLNISPLSWVSLGVSFVRTIGVLRKHKPSVVVSFGGYVGFTVGMAAFFCGIPLVIHEQTHIIGRANRLLEILSKKFLVSYPEQQTETRIYVGFPLREAFLKSSSLSFDIPHSKKIIYVTGGTTGAVRLNELIFANLIALTSQYTIIHQTGSVSLAKAEKLRELLPEDQKSSYYISSYLPPSDVGWLLHQAALVIGRSGANSVYELAVTKTPSVLFPLNEEQQHNAEWLQKYAPTHIDNQETISSKEFLSSIESLIANQKQEFPSVSTNGTERLVKEVLSFV